MTAAVKRYSHFLETLTPESLDRLREFVTPDVHFKDPFNDVHSADDMAKIFRHMFANVDDVRFIVHRAMTEGNICLMEWRFEGVLSGRPWSFDGTSRVQFADDGRVLEHIDYWDAAANFYERLPVIGWLLAKLRGRLTVR